MVSLIGLVLFQLQIPASTGYVNDFAGVIDPASQRAMLSIIDDVRAKSRGEIVVVTLRDLAGRAPIEVARDVGRQWGVGAVGGAGDAARNAGVILLLKPGARPGDGQAELAIATGSGAEGFVTDALAGRIRDAIGQVSVERGSYAAGLVTGVALLGQAYAGEFGFELTGADPQVPLPRTQPSSGGLGALAPLVMFLVFWVLAGALSPRRGRYGYRRGSTLQWLLLGMLLGGRGGRGPGGWGGGGFGGGGFGGFGGGGGFSGGGASGRF